MSSLPTSHTRWRLWLKTMRRPWPLAAGTAVTSTVDENVGAEDATPVGAAADEVPADGSVEVGVRGRQRRRWRAGVVVVAAGPPLTGASLVKAAEPAARPASAEPAERTPRPASAATSETVTAAESTAIRP